jgi:hypothetical protein
MSEQTAIISLYNINWLVCITETECVYCAVRTVPVYTPGYFVCWCSSGRECWREYVRLTGTCDVTVTLFVADGLGTMTQNWFLITYEFGLVVECCDRGEPKSVPMPLYSPQLPHALPGNEPQFRQWQTAHYWPEPCCAVSWPGQKVLTTVW